MDRSTISLRSFSLPASTEYRNVTDLSLSLRNSATPGTSMYFLTAEVTRLPASASVSNAVPLAVVSRCSDLTAFPPDAAPAEAAGIDSAVLLDPWSGEVPWRFSLSDVSGRAIASPRDPNQENSSFGWHGDKSSVSFHYSFQICQYPASHMKVNTGSNLSVSNCSRISVTVSAWTQGLSVLSPARIATVTGRSDRAKFFAEIC